MSGPHRLADAGLLGTGRSLEPPGALPYIARRLDAATPASAHEAELDVEALCVDATSFRVLRERAGGDPERIAALIDDVVRERGKLQNPWTGSGGILAGRVARIGARYDASDLRAGELVVPLASLVAIPLRLDAVGPVDPADAHVPVRGRAIVTGLMSCARVPADLRLREVMSALDVYPAPSHVRDLSRAGDHVLILGAGHAGLLAAAAAREAVGGAGAVTVVDVSEPALDRLAAAVPGARAVRADAADSVAVARELDRGADLALVCTSVPGCEATAILAAGDRGTVLFFSTATSFAAAGLGADSMSLRTRLVIPNGYTEDRGEYALELLRRYPSLRSAFARSAPSASSASRGQPA